MVKKIFPVLLAVGVTIGAFNSCKKTTTPNPDPTKNYFPVKLGKYVTYEVDSITFISGTGSETPCRQLEGRTQLKYAITDTFRDEQSRLSYIMDVFSRPDASGIWRQVRTILLTQAPIPQATTTPPPGTPQESILYTQNGYQAIKMVFPISEGISWQGNTLVDYNNPDNAYLKNWTYRYKDLRHSFNNGYVNYGNTVTVIEDDEAVNYPMLDSAVDAYRIYSKVVYAFDIGMVYKEWTHWTYESFNSKCVDGYTVVMRAIDHN